MKKLNIHNEDFKNSLLDGMNFLERNNFHFLTDSKVEEMKDYLKEYIVSEDYEFCSKIQNFLDKSVKSDRKMPKDELFDESARLFVRKGVASASYLQMAFKIDYTRAHSILEQLVSAGIINEFELDKGMVINAKNLSELEIMLKKIK